MPPRRRGPVLFVLARARSSPFSGSAAAPARHVDEHPATSADASSPLSWWLSGGRALRVPVGYVFVAAAVMLLFGVFGYFIGFSRADQMHRREAAARIERESAAMQDPLLSGAPVNTGLVSPRPEPRDAGRQTQQQAAAPTRQQTAQPGQSRAGASGDPRRPGLNYFVLAYYGPEDAERAVEFLKANGVDAGVYPTNNRRFRYVIAHDGFSGEQIRANARELRDFRARVLQLGRVWQSEHKGPSDFSDMWGSRYDP